MILNILNIVISIKKKMWFHNSTHDSPVQQVKTPCSCRQGRFYILQKQKGQQQQQQQQKR